jgi:hypothetical protein
MAAKTEEDGQARIKGVTMAAQEFFELYLKPCVEHPRKFLEYRSEIEEEWRELKREHVQRLINQEYREEAMEVEWMRRCIAIYRLLKK